MAISLTTDGLRLDYRNTIQSSVSGTYPIGTVIVASAAITLPGTWGSFKYTNFNSWNMGSSVPAKSISIRVK